MKRPKLSIILITIFAIILLVAGVILTLTNSRKQNGKEIKEEQYETEINRKLDKEKCTKDICINDLVITHEDDETGYNITGVIKNNTQEKLENKFYNLTFKNNKESSLLWIYIETLEANEEQFFQVSTMDKKVLNANQYSVEEASPDQVEKYLELLNESE